MDVLALHYDHCLLNCSNHLKQRQPLYRFIQINRINRHRRTNKFKPGQHIIIKFPKIKVIPHQSVKVLLFVTMAATCISEFERASRSHDGQQNRKYFLCRLLIYSNQQQFKCFFIHIFSPLIRYKMSYRIGISSFGIAKVHVRRSRCKTHLWRLYLRQVHSCHE